MKRGIEILLCWLVITALVDFVVPRSIPRNSMEAMCDRLTVFAFPLAAWVYARHSGRLSPVICYGLIAGAYCVFVPLPIFYNARGMLRREFTVAQEILIFVVPLLMASVCVGLCSLRRFLERENEKPDA